MSKSKWLTVGSLAISGMLVGLASFGGSALAASPATAAVPPAAVSASVQPTPATPVTQSALNSQAQATENAGTEVENQSKPEADNDNIDFQQQGEHEGDNGK